MKLPIPNTDESVSEREGEILTVCNFYTVTVAIGSFSQNKSDFILKQLQLASFSQNKSDFVQVCVCLNFKKVILF
jgi:hypothetical protein